MAQQHRFPAWKYLAPGIALLVSACGFLLQQYLQQLPWWADVPWFEMTLFCGGSLVGIG